jgi:hypothetical protein
MSSIIRNGDTYHGISVFGRGVFTDDKYGGRTYAGQHRSGHACGLGVATHSSGSKVYAEHGPDGKYDGRYLDRSAHGDTGYFLFERGKQKDFAYVSANGTYMYNYVACAPDDPRLLALIALVAPVEVRPAAPAPHTPLARPLAAKQSSDGSAGSLCPRRHWRRPRPPRCSPILHAVAGVVAQHNPTAATRKARPRSDVCTRPICRTGRTGGTLSHPNNRRLVHTKRSLPCHSPAHRVLNAAIRSGLCSLRIPFWFGRPRKPWPTCHCAWRCARTAATQVLRGTLGVLPHSRGTRGTL